MARQEYKWGTPVSAGDTSRAEAAARQARRDISTERTEMTTGIDSYLTQQKKRNQDKVEMEMDQLPDASARDAFMQELMTAQEDPSFGDAIFGADLPALQAKLPAMADQDAKDILHRETLRKEEDRVSAIAEMKDLQRYKQLGPEAFRDRMSDIQTKRQQRGATDPQGIFTRTANTLLRESDITIQPKTLTDLGVKLDDVNSHTGARHKQLHQKITNRLMQDNPDADLATAEKMATAAINKSPHGILFAQQMKFEKGQTKHDVALTKFAGALSTQLDLRDTAGVDRELNKLLRYMHTNRISDEDASFFAKDISRALKRTHLFTEAEQAKLLAKDPTLDISKFSLGKQAEALFSSLNKNWNPAGQVPISLTAQLEFKNYLRERYRDKYTHLTDAMLNAQIDEVINQSYNLNQFFKEGREAAQAATNEREAYVKSEHEYRADQRKKVQSISKKGALRHLADSVRVRIEKATADMDPKDKNNTMNKAMKEVDQIANIFKGLFTDRKTSEFAFKKDSDAYLAFWLTVENAVLGSVGVDVDSLTANDIILGLIDHTDEMHDAPPEKLLSLFTESQPRADSSIQKTFANDPKNVRNVQEGAYQLEEAIEAAKLRVADPANEGFIKGFYKMFKAVQSDDKGALAKLGQNKKQKKKPTYEVKPKVPATN